MTSARFSTLAVLGVVTGFVLEDSGFKGIRQVMEHFYPGVMTLGCAAMADAAAAEVSRQHPEIAALGECRADNWQDYANNAVELLGDTLELAGPHGTGTPSMRRTGK